MNKKISIKSLTKIRKQRPLLTAVAFAGGLLCSTANAEYQLKSLNYVDLSDGAEVSAQPIKTIAPVVTSSNQTREKILIKLDSVRNDHLTGIGGAFNEQGGEAFMRLPENMRKELAEALFNPTSGAGFSMNRTAVGASDFGLGAYSYSETPNDYKMEHFSVERDTKSVIPFIRAALAENPGMHIFASPWSPPGWMKVSGTMDAGDKNKEANVLKDSEEIYKAYALYFSKYVQAYAEHGIDISRLIVQNEVDMSPKYPGCLMSPEQMAELIADYIRPQFTKDALSTEIWAGSFRGFNDDAMNFMKNPKSDQADGLGVQYFVWRKIRDLKDQFADLDIMHTEGKCYDGENSFNQARNRFGEVVSYLENGTENFCYWNIALNEDSSSGWGWKQNSLVRIDRAAGSVTYNPDFAPMALLSKYIRPGDQLLDYGRVNRQGAYKPVLAVRSDTNITVFLQNKTKEAITETISVAGTEHAVDLAPHSLNAFVFE
jgi:glucosylceramidase